MFSWPADPDSMAEAGLGVKGGTFYSSYRGGCFVMWTRGCVSDMDAGAVAPDGGSHGWLSGGHHGGGGGYVSWLCGRQELWWRVTRACSVSGSGGALLRT